MKVKVITKWQYTKLRKIHTGSTRDWLGNESENYESKPFRYTNRRIIFPTHKTGLLFKKKCTGSNVKRVIKSSKRLYTQEEIDEIEDGRAQFPS